MTIASELTKLQTNLSNAYTSCNNKGATMPSSQNFDNLANTIDSIETGGGGITPTGTINIIENGTYDVTNYASAEVNVAGSGGGSSGAFDLIGAGLESAVVLPDSSTIKEGGFRNACTNFKDLTFNLLDWKVYYDSMQKGTLVAESKSFQEAFKGNLSTEEVSFQGIGQFNANDVFLDCFVDSVVQKIKFYYTLRSQVTNQIGYDNKFGSPTATISYIYD